MHCASFECTVDLTTEKHFRWRGVIRRYCLMLIAVHVSQWRGTVALLAVQLLVNWTVSMPLEVPLSSMAWPNVVDRFGMAGSNEIGNARYGRCETLNGLLQ